MNKEPDRHEEEEEEGSPAWMCSYCDMITILLACFIMLYSISNLDLAKFHKAAASIQKALIQIPGLSPSSYRKPIDTGLPWVPIPARGEPLETMPEEEQETARVRIADYQKSRDFHLAGTAEGIRITLSGRILFESGRAVLNPDTRSILLILAATLNDHPNAPIRLEGHTDPAPLPGDSPFPDHWRLAEARALAVLDFLRDQGKVQESRFHFLACGSSRPRFPNDSSENQTLNNRMEIFLDLGRDLGRIRGVLEQYGEKIDPDTREFAPIK
ncbi:MAG: flagellar motor protein MotB [bacterium]